MIPLDTFFPHLKEFNHRGIFDDIEWVWDPLKRLGETIGTLIREKAGAAERAEVLDGMAQTDSPSWCGTKAGRGIFVERWIETTRAVYLAGPEVLIGPGTLLEPSAIIKGPAIIGADCEIRQGAYIRGNVLVGDHCVIGHATEVKNSVIMNHTESGHFNYIGDSIIGSHVNLGAGSRLANFQFRTPEEKERNIIRPIELNIEGSMVQTGMEKLGAVLGDAVEVGCNAVLCPGTLVGKTSWIYPNTTVPKGYYPPGKFLAPRDRKPRISDK